MLISIHGGKALAMHSCIATVGITDGLAAVKIAHWKVAGMVYQWAQKRLQPTRPERV
jgi:hypothetical protein